MKLHKHIWGRSIFGRRINKRTAGTFQTRVITQGVIPSLHVGYKFSKIKQYFKEEKALRTETTINDTYDFGVGRNLDNLSEPRAIGFSANRRLLEVETISQDCSLAEGVFEMVTRPRIVDGKRVSGLRFDDHRVIALAYYKPCVDSCCCPMDFPTPPCANGCLESSEFLSSNIHPSA